MKELDLVKVQEVAKKVRRDIVEMTYKAGTTGAHIGGSLSAVEILSAMYCGVLNYNKANLYSEDRDRFVFSKGHAAMALYSILFRVGIMQESEFNSFKVDGSYIASHPHMDESLGIEFSSGSLGLGLSQAVGQALGLRIKGNDASTIYVFQGDGECDEGSVWEAAMSAANFKLDNIILVIDRNELQLDGPIEDVMSLGEFNSKWNSFGWNVIDADGHDILNLYAAFAEAKNFKNGKPTVIVAHTIKGKGISFIENQPQWHVNMLNKKLYEKAIEELN